MSCIRAPNSKGVRSVDLGGVEIGTVEEVQNGVKYKKQSFSGTESRMNLAVRALVANYRNN